jgi:hypothetical protein
MKKGYKDAKAEMTTRLSSGPHQYYIDVKDTFYREEDEL